jgi:outer membrane protein OmpA-like peptidoglycan-associated protein
MIVSLAGCAMFQRDPDTQRTTERDKTKKGAMIGAAGGAVAGAAAGDGELDKILAGAAIGAGIGAGIGAYMDRQEERLAQIPGTRVERVDEKTLLVHFESDILFSVNSSELNPSSRQTLDEAVDVFLEFDKTGIVAQGHTDATGSETYNLELSERRASAVMLHLVHEGIDSSRIAALGFGESYPIASNDSNEGRRQNRRVDLMLRAKAR